MRYIRVKWKHSNPNDPIFYYCELDETGWENRKVEVFANGEVGYSDAKTTSPLSMGLSIEPIPPLDEIAQDPQFEPSEITAEEFETVWTEAITMVQTETSEL